MLYTSISSVSKTYPVNPNIINVKNNNYSNLTGNGITDDTAALKSLISQILANDWYRTYVLYFPDGEYILSDSIQWRTPTGTWCCGMWLQGQSEKNTVIRLKANSLGFNTPNAPKPLIETGSRENNTPKGIGNKGFFHKLFDFTIKISNGNSGAIAVDWLGSNESCVKNVSIIYEDLSANTIAINCKGENGPALFENTKIYNRGIGIQIEDDYHSCTFNKIYLESQQIGIKILSHQAVFIEKIETSNVAQPINANKAFLTIDTGRFMPEEGITFSSAKKLTTSSSSGQPIVFSSASAQTFSQNAIEMGGYPGQIYIRNLTTSGYANAFANPPLGQFVSGGIVQNYSSITEVNLFPNTSIFPNNFFRKEVPEFTNYNHSDWAIASIYVPFNYTANDSNGNTNSIQAAFDSGKPVVAIFAHIPGSAQIFVNRTLVIPPHVKAILGFGSIIEMQGSGDPVFKVVDGTEPLHLQQVHFNYIVHQSNRELRLSNTNGDIVNAAPSSGSLGDLVFEDLCGRFIGSTPQKVFGIQWNPEGSADPRSVFTGGSVFIIGTKTEGNQPFLKLVDVSSAYFCGVWVYGFGNCYGAMIESIDSDVDVMFTGVTAGLTNYPVVISETRRNQTKTLPLSSAPIRYGSNPTARFRSISEFLWKWDEV